jgi:hypothetical protein
MHDNDDDDENTINAGGGMEIPKRQRSRRGQLQCFGVDGGYNDNSGEGDCNARRHGDETTTLDDDNSTRFPPSTAAIIMGQHDNRQYIADT